MYSTHRQGRDARSSASWRLAVPTPAVPAAAGRACRATAAPGAAVAPAAGIKAAAGRRAAPAATAATKPGREAVPAAAPGAKARRAFKPFATAAVPAVLPCVAAATAAVRRPVRRRLPEGQVPGGAALSLPVLVPQPLALLKRRPPAAGGPGRGPKARRRLQAVTAAAVPVWGAGKVALGGPAGAEWGTALTRRRRGGESWYRCGAS